MYPIIIIEAMQNAELDNAKIGLSKVSNLLRATHQRLSEETSGYRAPLISFDFTCSHPTLLGVGRSKETKF